MENYIKQFETINKLEKNIKEFKKLTNDLINERKEDIIISNISSRVWQIVSENFDPKNIIVVNGEMFYKIDNKTRKNAFWDIIYTCKRIKFDLTLTSQLYEVTKVNEYDEDDKYIDSFYEVKEIINLDEVE